MDSRTDQGRYKNYLKALFGNKEPHKLDPLSIDRLRINLLKKRSPQTTAHVLNLLTWIINFGVKKNLSDPIKFHISKPVVNNTPSPFTSRCNFNKNKMFFPIFYSVFNFLLIFLLTLTLPCLR